MAHGDLHVEARERRGEAGRSVTMHEHNIGLLILENGLELEKHVASHIEQGLAWFHNHQVVVGSHVKDTKNLVEHLAVLSRHCHDSLKFVFTSLQFVNERAHLDCLRASAEDEHYFLHSSSQST